MAHTVAIVVVVNVIVIIFVIVASRLRCTYLAVNIFCLKLFRSLQRNLNRPWVSYDGYMTSYNMTTTKLIIRSLKSLIIIEIKEPNELLVHKSKDKRDDSPVLSILAFPKGITNSGSNASSGISNCTPYMTSFSSTTTEVVNEISNNLILVTRHVRVNTDQFFLCIFIYLREKRLELIVPCRL